MTCSVASNFARRFAKRFLLASLLPCLLATVTLAGTVSGTVTNGTTGKPAAGVEVILIQLQGTMQPVANTKTDAQGRYQLSSDILGTAPMLLRAVYRGVFYHQPVPPGTTTADVQVFEPTDKASAFSITAHAIILQPNGSSLTVGEEFNISNTTNPPVAYYRPNGSFLFTLPQGAQVQEVSAGGSSGMPVIQTPIDKGNGVQAIDFPFRPGDSEVRVTYSVPYSGDQTTLHTKSMYDATNVAYFAAPTVHVTADGFSPAGTEQGYDAYLRKTVPANTELVASISGTAPPPSNADSSSSGDNSQNAAAGTSGDSSASSTPAANITTMPARLDSLKWVLAAGFAVIFALGAIFVMRRPDALAVAGTGEAAAVPPPPVVPKPKPAPPAPAFKTVSDLDGAVGTSLDQLKDALFRLELRHQAGTISVEDYGRERQRIDQKLRDLVQG
ncbi:MAG TPA: hypothetical protein VMB47_18760 [Candidatus Aquilonibacter sp.]|nr:hypothetical protein [Candidatus Aquilonibacter sp.]